MAMCLVIAVTSSCVDLRGSKLQHRLMSWSYLGPTVAFGAFATLTQALAVPIIRSLEWFEGPDSEVGAWHAETA